MVISERPTPLRVPLIIEDHSFEDIEALMLGKAIPEDGNFKHPMANTSLLAQLDVLGIRSDEATKPPDAVFVTFASCLPVADTIRGVYQALGTQIPNIYTVFAQRRMGFRYFNGISTDEDKAVIDKEISRLEKIVSGMSVAVVDQYVCTGRTLQLACELLRNSGVARTSEISGRWFAQYESYYAPIITEAPTSTYAKQMFTIGNKCVASLLS